MAPAGPSPAAAELAQALTPAAASAPTTTAVPAPSAADLMAQTQPPSVTVATPATAAAASPDPSLAANGMTPNTAAAAHASPAGQIAPALMSLGTSTNGTQQLTLRLDPAELGTVQVRIDRPADAPAHVDISVSRPETLTLMLRDQSQLQHTLDQAGVPAEGRTISFHLADQGAGQGTNSQSQQAGGFGHSNGYDQTPRHGSRARNANDTDADTSLLSSSPMRWQRAGLNITA